MRDRSGGTEQRRPASLAPHARSRPAHLMSRSGRTECLSLGTILIFLLLAFFIADGRPGCICSGFAIRGSSVFSEFTVKAEGRAWVNANPPVRPNPRSGHAMAYDAESDRVILFGGAPAGGTWAYDVQTNRWTDMNPSDSPPVTIGHAMTYDAESDRVILFGGDDGFRDRQETWAYDFNSNAWTNRKPAPAPAARSSHAVVYNRQSDRMILFGGCSGFPCQQLGDTWAYDFNTNTWTSMNPSIGPGARYGHALAYDVKFEKCILFGGYDGHHRDDTWAYDYNSNSWTLMIPPLAPSARRAHAMTFDPRTDGTVLFGGCADPCVRTSDLSSETWTYDLRANKWNNLNPSLAPLRRWIHAMTYDHKSGQVVLFGGSLGDGGISNETWIY